MTSALLSRALLSRSARSPILTSFGVLLSLCLCLCVSAEFASVFIQEFPVERVIANLEDIVQKNPKDVSARYNLARAHAMAYALKTTTLPIADRYERGIWLGYESNSLPFAKEVVAAETDDVRQAARVQLEKAIERYRETMELAPDNLPAKLGYAWCIEQSGDKAKTISAYRSVIAEAWAKEAPVNGRSPVSASFNWTSVAAEAAGYLIPLLDPQRDRDEIATLRDRIAQISRLPRMITPIAIPLTDTAGINDIVSLSSRVHFDADGSGLEKSWTWITPKAGWLVWAPDQARPITSALQMFGNVTFWLFWENGYEAMRALDDDHDGALRGSELDGLAVWQDRNSNGIQEEGEVKSLAGWGIVALSCTHENTPERPEFAAMSPAGVTFADGHSRPTYDILLYERPENGAISGLLR